MTNQLFRDSIITCDGFMTVNPLLFPFYFLLPSKAFLVFLPAPKISPKQTNKRPGMRQVAENEQDRSALSRTTGTNSSRDDAGSAVPLNSCN